MPPSSQPDPRRRPTRRKVAPCLHAAACPGCGRPPPTKFIPAPSPGDLAILIRWDGPGPAPVWLFGPGDIRTPAGVDVTREAVDLKRLLKALLRSHGFRAVTIHRYPAAQTGTADASPPK